MITADKTGAKVIEDWICPSAKIAFSPRRVEGVSDHVVRDQSPSADVGGDDVGGGVDELANQRVVKKTSQKLLSPNAVGTLPVHYILLTVGSLVFLLVAIGVVSYFVAVRS